MKGLGVSSIFAFVAGVLSFGVLVPEGLRAFVLLAAAGAMSGCSVGQIVAKRVKSGKYQTILIISSLFVTVGSLLSYLRIVESGSANFWVIGLLGALLTVTFFSFCFLLPIAGIVIQKDWFPAK